MSAAVFYILNRAGTPELPAACVSSLAAELELEIPEVRAEVDEMRKRGWILEDGHRDTGVAHLSLTQKGWHTFYLTLAHTEKKIPNSLHYLRFDSQFQQYAPTWLRIRKRRKKFAMSMGYNGQPGYKDRGWVADSRKFRKDMGTTKIKKRLTDTTGKVREVPTHDEATRIDRGGDLPPERSEQEALQRIRAL